MKYSQKRIINRIVLTVFIFILIVFSEEVPLENSSSWMTQTVDSAGNVGFATSIALDSNNYPHISYYDYDNQSLKYARWTGTNWYIATLDSMGPYGVYTSIALDSNDLPHISYYDSSGNKDDLKYIQWEGPGNYTITTVDYAGQVGLFNSIAVDSSDHPHISYKHGQLADLKYARWTGANWAIETVDSSGDVGSYSSIALDSNDYPTITYHDGDNYNLKYARWTGGDWYIATIDSGLSVGRYTSVALDSNDIPHIAYEDWATFNLKYVSWYGPRGWGPETVDSEGYIGGEISLAVDSDDYPHISYYDGSKKDLKYARKTVSGWDIQTVVTTKDSGSNASIALDSHDLPHISFLERNGGPTKLKYTQRFQNSEDFLGTWDGSGVYYRNFGKASWVKLGPPGELVAAGDLDGDGTDDILWCKTGDGVWVKQSSTKSWTKQCAAPAVDMTSGDMNGDGRDDLVGIWSSGVYYKNSIGGAWVQMAPPADLIATGDLDGDGIDDLLWSKAGDGVWVKHSSTLIWSKQNATPALDMTSGDMNGDGRDDLVGLWSSGVFYKDPIGGAWVKMGPAGALIGVGDLDGDGMDDLLWSKSGDGVWVKYSFSASWSKLHGTAARHMDAGFLRGGVNHWPSAAIEGFVDER
jgi:hypothetical protein